MADTFVALDFETADYKPDSACAIGIVRVQKGKIVERAHHLIQPPRKWFRFTYIHGITWKDVAAKPTFAELWPEVEGLFKDVEFIAAHNAGFDRRVLTACCDAAGLAPPEPEFLCTVALSRSKWGIYPTKLPNVCSRLGIELKHHEALSDAEACARIVMTALQEGHDLADARA